MSVLGIAVLFGFFFNTVVLDAKKFSSRIIGGEDASAGDFPFIAAINVQTANGRFFCGGAILTARWLITSGHCAYNAVLFTIQLGSVSLNLDDSGREIVSTSEYILHPDFDPDKIENDLAMIKFRTPITFNDYIQPIMRPGADVNNGVGVTAVGWGQISDNNSSLSERLQKVDVTTVSNEECRLVYGNQITDNMLCVVGNYNEGTCTGDNGSPLIEYYGFRYTMVAVASFLSGNGCESTDPSGYTRLYPYLDWINNNLMT